MKKQKTQSYYKKLDGTVATLFTAPAFILFTLFLVVPIVAALYISLLKWDGSAQPLFVGLQNYQYLFKDRDFWIAFKNSMILVALHLSIQTTSALMFAYFLYRTRRGMRFFRSVYFLPSVIATTAIGVMVSLMLNSDLGPINQLLRNIGLGSIAKPWLSDTGTVLYAVSLTMIWQYIGYHAVILLAGMQSISEEVIESAVIDGASSPRIFFRIVMPLVKDMLQISIILSVVGCLKAFDHSYIMTWGGPGMSSTYLAVYMFKKAYLKSDLGGGTAIGLVILLLAFIATRIINWAFYHKDEESVT